MSLPHLRATDIETIARSLTITQHDGGARAPWVPHLEQRRYWEAAERHRAVYVAKARQVGLSTAVTLEDLLWVMLADAAGHTVRCAVVVDTYEKALERVRVVGDFAAQMELEHTAQMDRVIFPHGSEVVAFSAAGDGVGRSLSVQRYHLTELPYWERPAEAYGSLMQSLSIGGRVTIETTMSTRDPFARHLWRAPSDYHRLFLPFELHAEYRASPDSITDAQWAECEADGFTRRDSAAYWCWLLDNRCGGDRLLCLREYPQREEHLFQADAARFVRSSPAVTDHATTIRTAGMDGDTLITRVWRGPREGSGQYRVSVDTAAGKERDRSIVLCTDVRDGALCALFASDVVAADDLARVALDVCTAYTTPDRMQVPQRPRCYIEDNGIGEATCQAANRIGLSYERVTTTEESKYRGLLAAKRAVESGVFRGPAELAEECDELHRDDLGRFRGRKDILMAYGFAALARTVDGYREPTQPIDERVRVKRRIVLEQMKARVGLR